MAGVSDQKVAGGREQALGWVSWAFANGKEGSVTWERDLGWWGSSTWKLQEGRCGSAASSLLSLGHNVL